MVDENDGNENLEGGSAKEGPERAPLGHTRRRKDTMNVSIVGRSETASTIAEIADVNSMQNSIVQSS